MITVGSVWPRPIDTPITSLSRPHPPKHTSRFSHHLKPGTASRLRPTRTNKFPVNLVKRLRPRREDIDASCGLSARQRLSVVSQVTS